MQDISTKLLSNYEQIATNLINRLEPGLSADEVVSKYKESVQSIIALRRNTDSMLKEHLYPILDNIAEISDEEDAELYAIAQKLSSYQTRHDPGLALRIYKVLLERARTKKDDAKILKYLFLCTE
jgi:hypothetical protein